LILLPYLKLCDKLGQNCVTEKVVSAILLSFCRSLSALSFIIIIFEPPPPKKKDLWSQLYFVNKTEIMQLVIKMQ
jgi:hypothetical protein